MHKNFPDKAPRVVIKRNKKNKRSSRVVAVAIHRPSAIASSGLVHAKPSIPFMFKWPLKKGTFWLSSRFGYRMRSKKGAPGKLEMHHGLDMAAPTGTPVYAAWQGKVRSASYQPGYGNCIILTHEPGIETRYAHLHQILVSVGEEISEGNIIGKVGKTGNTRGKYDASHLHFEVIIGGRRYDPLFYLV